MTVYATTERLLGENRIVRLYETLFEHYGPQGWWPAVSRAGEPGYDERGYHPGIYSSAGGDDAVFFDVVCGAVLTQNTAWTNAERALLEMRRRGIDSCERINAARTYDLAEAVRSSGYYNQKAKKLRLLAEALNGRHILRAGDSKGFSEERIKEFREGLLHVWGLGPETVDSILLYAYDLPLFVIDTYTRRLVERVFGLTGIPKGRRGYEFLQDIFQRALEKNTVIYGEYHALIVRHCKESCTVRPRCIGCILEEQCLFHHGAET